MVKIGIVVFANYSGLGNQTRRLVHMIKPDRILVINSESFSKNKTQNYQWYEGFSGYLVQGFPTNNEIRVFLRGLTDVIVCENPLNFALFSMARNSGVRTYCQSNYEFCDNLCNPSLPLPDYFLMPSYWKNEEMRHRFPNRVKYLPPPIDPNEFTESREANFNRSPERIKLLHIIGTLAAKDRNGTLDLLRALQFTRKDFQLTIKSQHELPKEYIVKDHRVSYSITNEPNTALLYKDFDALILPRRYGGLALTCNEALMSGLPVIMPDISPNNQLLPAEWLVKAFKTDVLQTRDLIDVFAVKPRDLAEKIDWLLDQDLATMKTHAFDLGYTNFSTSVLAPKYKELWT